MTTQLIQSDPVVFIHDGKSYWLDIDVTETILKEKNYNLPFHNRYSDVGDDEIIEFIEMNKKLWELEEQQDESLLKNIGSIGVTDESEKTQD